jgi:NADP-reducing hydrogenase subunit HndB
MAKIKSLDDLRKIRESTSDLSSARTGQGTVVVVGMGTCGIAAGAREIMNSIMAELARRGITDVAVQTTGCIGMCEKEPLVDVIRDGSRVTYGPVTPGDVATIVAEHVVNGRVVDSLAIGRAD